MLTHAVPVWTTPGGSNRLALLDLGTLFHRGGGAPIPVRLWNSLGHPDAPTMSLPTLTVRPLDAFTSEVLALGDLRVWRDGWHSLADPVELAALAGGEGVDLWFQLELPTEIEMAPTTGRLFAELLLTWE